MTSDARVERPRARGSALSLVWATAGMITCGVVLGTIAMVNSMDAQKAMDENPELGGHTLAQMGYWFGLFAIVQHVIRLGLRVASL